MDRIINLCDQYKAPYGDHVVKPNPKLLEKRIKQGYQFLAHSRDGYFLYLSSSVPKPSL